MGHRFSYVNCDLDIGDMALSQGHDTPLGHGQQSWELLSRSNLAMRGYGHGFFCMCALWPWHKRYDLGSMSWQTLGSWTISMWNIIQIQPCSEELWPEHGFSVYVPCDLDLRDMTLAQGHDTPLGHGQQLCEMLSRSILAVRLWLGHRYWVSVHCDLDLQYMAFGQGHDTSFGYGQRFCEILPRSNMTGRSYGLNKDFGCVCVLWPWHLRYNLGSRSWHTLGSWTTIVWNIIQIQLDSEELWPGHGFWVCVHCDFDLDDMTFGQGLKHPSVIDNNCLKYYPDQTWQRGVIARYMCTMTLTLEIWYWVKVMTHPWVMDNNCVKYYPDPT